MTSDHEPLDSSVGRQIGIVGGHGQIARLLTRELTGRGHHVRGLVRSVDQFDDLRRDGAEPVLCDLEQVGGSELDEVLHGVDIVVFAAGAGPNSGPERKNSLDRDGAIESVESAIRIGAERFVIVSSMGADDPPVDDEVFSVYLRAKHDADAAVRAACDASGVSYSIVRPGRLTDDEPTGSVQIAAHAERSAIPRGDVATVLAQMIDDECGHDVTFEVVSGSTAIADAVRSFG